MRPASSSTWIRKVALADYFGRAALAAAQVLQGFDESAFRDTLARVRVGLTFADDASASHEGRTLLELTVRLVARLYPTLVIRGVDGAGAYADQLRDLARAINPNIEFGSEPTIEIVVGEKATPTASLVVYAGSRGWEALVGTGDRQPIGTTTNPFGAAAAACLASANVFRAVFLGSANLDDQVIVSTFRHDGDAPVLPDSIALGEGVLFGAGAVGMAALWTLAAAPITGTLHVVDHQNIDLGNLQRYILASRQDEGRAKVELVSSHFRGRLLRIHEHPLQHADFLSRCGYRWDRVLLALDSARDRRAVQAALPKWVANSWTQPGDLGVSVHARFGEAAACVACLYLPESKGRNEDQIVAEALGISERLMEVRILLHNGEGVPRSLLEAIAAGLDRPLDRLLPFEGKSIRTLYVEGVCGGQVLPLARAGGAPAEVHVPLAHQSALAGVLLAAAFVSDALMEARDASTIVTRVNLLRPLTTEITQPALADPRGICFCQDPHYRAAYVAKYTTS